MRRKASFIMAALLAALLVFAVSCSDSNSGGFANLSDKIDNPPSWLQGSWACVSDSGESVGTLRAEPNSLCMPGFSDGNTSIFAYDGLESTVGNQYKESANVKASSSGNKYTVQILMTKTDLATNEVEEQDQQTVITKADDKTIKVESVLVYKVNGKEQDRYTSSFTGTKN